MNYKHIYIVLAGLLLFSGVKGQEVVKWYSIAEALELTAKEPRILVIDVYTDWCGWCKRMDAATFSNEEIATTLNKDFYPVKLDAEGKEDIVIGDKTYKFVDNGRKGYHELAAIVTKGRLSYPTISCVDEKGRVLNAYPGYKDAKQFKLFLAYFNEDAYIDKTWEEYKNGSKEITVPDI
jgi:thioredoxin-related protein